MKEVFENIKEKIKNQPIEQFVDTNGNWDLVQTVLDCCCEAVDRVKEEYNNGWIACSERLPEVDGNTSDVVLVCTVDGFQHMAFWCDDKKWRYCESGMIKNTMEWTEIIAWQPLPAPYQPKGE